MGEQTNGKGSHQDYLYLDGAPAETIKVDLQLP